MLLDGALAIITGRDIATIDRILAPHLLPVSGVHGFEMRAQSGPIKRLAAADGALLQVIEKLRTFADQHEGLLVETKPGSVALHYRGRPDLAEACLAAVAEAVDQAPDLRLMHGKMVIEVKAHGGDKGKALSAFMQVAPFASRRPVFIGDDVTDESAFAEVNKRGGVSIKVGGGQTTANCHLADTGAVRDWLRRLCDQMEKE